MSPLNPLSVAPGVVPVPGVDPDRRCLLAAAPRGHLAGDPDGLLHVREDILLVRGLTARARNRRFWLLSVLRAHTNAPYNTRFTMENAKGA